MSILLKNILRFILLILVQVFVLNRILLYQLVNPYIYLMFILIMPFRISRPLLILSALALGLCMDGFMNTMGMHAAACVIIAYLRPFVINILAPPGGFEYTQRSPSISTMGVAQFTVYTLILVVIHHMVYFSLELFGFGGIFYLLLKILVSSAVSIGLILLTSMLFYSKGK
ncbi:MAG TPA: rod shape-determining protein MreD [Chitinophagaceae bacterium]|nr:rod shape-determining protein MreD [Chitinophagaceae bacterium]